MIRRILIAFLFLFLIQAYAYSTKLIVTSAHDSIISPAAGMLRTCIHDAETGDTILFEVDTVYADTTFFLGDKSIFILGDAENMTKIVGDSSFTIFEVDITDVNRIIEIHNLEISLGYGFSGALLLQGRFPNKFIMQGCTLVNNYSMYTGAVSLGGGTISNCWFLHNICVGGEKYKSESAGLFGSYTTIDSCVFIDNHNYSESSRYTAGALNVRYSSVSNCRFLNNSAHGTDAGGALHSNFSTINNCFFEGNFVRPDGSGNAGAAVALATDFYNSFFINNKGGDYYIDYNSSGAVASRGEVSYTNCLFTGNSSKMVGALSLASNDKHVTNCTFYNNYAEYYGGILLHSISDGKLNVKNSILYGNVPNNVQCINNSELRFSYTAIEGTLMPGTGNILLHNSPFQSQLAQDSYFLNDTSPCINRGDTTGVLTYIGNTDVMGMDRIINDTIDLGAVEFYHRISPLVIWPTSKAITYGDSLYKAVNSDGTANINGYFSFDSSLVLDAGEHLTEILFSPEKSHVYTYKSLTDSITINVNKSVLIARAKDTTIIFDDKEPVYQLEYEGFVNNDDITEIDTKPDVYVDNFTGLGIGEYEDAIVVTGGADNNYEFVYQNGTLIITQRASFIADLYRDISLYPNPVKYRLEMINLPVDTRYALFDMSGKIVLQGKTDDCNAILDLSGLKNGVYILSMSLTELTKEVKIIKH